MQEDGKDYHFTDMETMKKACEESGGGHACIPKAVTGSPSPISGQALRAILSKTRLQYKNHVATRALMANLHEPCATDPGGQVHRVRPRAWEHVRRACQVGRQAGMQPQQAAQQPGRCQSGEKPSGQVPGQPGDSQWPGRQGAGHAVGRLARHVPGGS